MRAGSKGRVRAALSFAFALAAAAPAQADTLQDALVGAYRNNPNLEDARLGVRAAREDRVQAFSAYLPRLEVFANAGDRESDIEDPGNPFPPSRRVERELSPTTSTGQLTQDLYTGGRRGAQMRLASAGLDGARSGLRATEQDVLLAALQAYVNVRRDEEVLRLRQAYVEGLRRQVSGARRRLEVGEVTRTDLAQAQSRLAGARANLAGAEAALETSRARYAEVIGAEPRDLAPPPAAPEPPANLQDAIAMAEARHPELEQARDAVRAARARVGLERSALLPQVSLVGRWSRYEEQDAVGVVEEDQVAMAQLSVPLFEGGYAWSRTRQGRINVERAEALVEAQRRAVSTDVLSSWTALRASSEIVAAAHEQSEAAEEAWRGAEREHGLGLRSTIEVLDAELEWRQAQIAQARVEADAYIAAYALQSAIGALSYEGLGLAAR